jgi:hypothetical protein
MSGVKDEAKEGWLLVAMKSAKSASYFLVCVETVWSCNYELWRDEFVRTLSRNQMALP